MASAAEMITQIREAASEVIRPDGGEIVAFIPVEIADRLCANTGCEKETHDLDCFAKMFSPNQVAISNKSVPMFEGKTVLIVRGL